VIYRACAKDIV